MKKIIVGFSSHKTGIVSKAIKIIERTPYSHVYVKFHSDTINRDFIYQASGLAVNFMGNDIFISLNNVIKEFEFEVSDDVYKSVMTFAVDNVGKPYSISEMLGLGFVIIMGYLGKKVDNPFAEGQSEFVCSKLVTDIVNFFLKDKIEGDLDNISPKDLYSYIEMIKQSQDKII